MNKTIIIFVGYFVLIATGFATSAFASECGTELYFSPSDDETPLRKPHSEFLKMRRLANAGDAVAQRNLAVSYENGYLVTQCPEKALYWYRKAAANGDNIAQSWVARYDQYGSQMQQPAYIRPEPAPTGNAATGTVAGKGKAIAKPVSKIAPKSASERSRERYEDAERESKICFSSGRSGCPQLVGDSGSDCWQTYSDYPKDPSFTRRLKESAEESYGKCLERKRAEQLYGK